MEDDEIFAVAPQHLEESRPRRIRLVMAGSTVNLMIDTGSPINIIDNRVYLSLVDKPRLGHCSRQYFGLKFKKPLPISRLKFFLITGEFFPENYLCFKI